MVSAVSNTSDKKSLILWLYYADYNCWSDTIVWGRGTGINIINESHFFCLNGSIGGSLQTDGKILDLILQS
jgi:hypothetical protein